MAITVAQLRAFLTVAEAGSVREAARRLYVSQPSVSALVAALGGEVGAPLLDRDGRGIRLSPAGAAFLPYARDTLGLLDAGARDAREAADGVNATLRVAAVTTAGEHLLPERLRAFLDRHDGTSVSLVVGNRARVLHALTSREADVAVAGRAPDGGEVEARPFASNPHVLIAAPGHPRATARAVPLDALAGDAWLAREAGSGTRSLVEAYLAENGIQPPLHTIGSNGAIREAVAAGLGIAVVPRVAAQAALDAGQVAAVDVRPAPPERAWHVLVPATRPRAVALAFADFVCTPTDSLDPIDAR